MIIQSLRDRQTPRVTVLMSVYNGERYLREAIESILGQTFTDFKFIIVNDGSTDSSRDIVLSYSDPRIRLIDNPENMGLIKSLNRGLALARGEYVARQDADDRSLPFRLEKQVAFLEVNPAVALLGTQARVIDEYGIPVRFLYFRKPVTKFGIQWRLMIDSAFVHSSVMFRRNVIWDELRGYNEAFVGREDADLWSRVILNHEVQNLPETLVDYRSHSASVTANYGKKSEDSFFEIIRRNLHRYLQSEVIPGDQWIRFHLTTYSGRQLSHKKDGQELLDGFFKIFNRFSELNPEVSFNFEIQQALSCELMHVANYLATRNKLQSIKAFIMACRADISVAKIGVVKYFALFFGGGVAKHIWLRFRKSKLRRFFLNRIRCHP